MTARRMTAEEVEGLRLPEGFRFREGGYLNVWAVYDTASLPLSLKFVVVVAEGVANGHLPRAILDWAWAHVDGREVPTPEQWEAAKELVGRIKTEEGNLVCKELCDIIFPPKLPAIEPCPYCGAECERGKWERMPMVLCPNYHCPYNGPVRDTDAESIAAHNEIARKLRPVEPKPRTCGECRHWRHSGGCGHPRYWEGVGVPGFIETLDSRCSETRDASKCERWEPKP